SAAATTSVNVFASAAPKPCSSTSSTPLVGRRSPGPPLTGLWTNGCAAGGRTSTVTSGYSARHVSTAEASCRKIAFAAPASAAAEDGATASVTQTTRSTPDSVMPATSSSTCFQPGTPEQVSSTSTR